jgi:hypothetical protein
MRSLGYWLVALCLCLLLVQAVSAAEHVVRDVVAGGGGAAASAEYRLLHTVGQSVIGIVSGTAHEHEQGFWYLPWFFVTGAEDEVPLPRAYRLYQNYPNPFNPVTTIRFALVRPARVTVRIYDVMGRLVSTVVDEEMEAGEHSVPFEAEGLASGVYFYRLKAAEFEKTRKMVVLR